MLYLRIKVVMTTHFNINVLACPEKLGGGGVHKVIPQQVITKTYLI